MRVLAILIGTALAAIFVTAFAAAAPQEPPQEDPLAPPAESAPAEAQPEPMQMAAAIAGLSALLVVAPLAGKF
jgi:hypothetical protein